LADIAQGRIIQSLAAEGGPRSTLWAGPEAFSRAMKAGTQPVEGLARKNPISLKLGFSGDDYGYAIDLGLPRPLKTSELSDGTLRYLLLVAALLSPRPPALMILNEPETSLHPDLLPPLARLIAQA
jgi:predicted ATPase